MEKLEHCQTVLPSTVLEKLKEVTGDPTTKGALSIAVEHTTKTYVKPEKAQKKVN